VRCGSTSPRKYEVLTTADGASGLAAMARACPDVLILDLGLPDMDGADVIKGVRGQASTPIIVSSAAGQESTKVAALDPGADDYITKPFGMDELLARLRAAVRRASPAPDEPVVATEHFTVDLAAKRVTRDGTDVRLTPHRMGSARSPRPQPRPAGDPAAAPPGSLGQAAPDRGQLPAGLHRPPAQEAGA
jgi:DNA-binding response OmpR family regulator